MSELREKAKAYFDKNIPVGTEVHSNGATAALFTALTNTTHETLVKNWTGDGAAANYAHGGYQTTCNEFVGKYSGYLGSNVFLGQFELEALLKKLDKSYAWIRSDGVARPKYGDIFRPNSYHMGISLDFDGNTWKTIESGQGGPNRDKDGIPAHDKEGKLTGFDIIKRKAEPWKPKTIRGWCDIDLYFGGPDAVSSDIGAEPPFTLEQLYGWWVVSSFNGSGYYYFDRNGQVKTSTTAPLNPGPPNVATGSPYSLDNNSVMINWSPDNWEQFNGPPSGGSMPGLRKSSSPITARKL